MKRVYQSGVQKRKEKKKRTSDTVKSSTSLRTWLKPNTSCAGKILLAENCQDIDKVYEYRKHTDLETTSKCSKLLYNLCIILSGVQNHPQDKQRSKYAARYLANDKVLTSHLVQIVADAEDIRLCSCAVEILYTLLSHNDASMEEDVKQLKRNLIFSTHFSQLLESVYSLNAKFSKTKCSEILLPELYVKLLCILSIIYESKRSRELYLSASTDTVRFLGILLSTSCCNNIKLLNYLLPVLNILCHKKKNCDILYSQKFFDSVSAACKLTKKVLTVVSILKLISRSEAILSCMASNESVVKLLLNLLNYVGKKHISKRWIIALLYRITKTEQGLDILKKNENYQCLLDWITNSQNLDVFQNRMTVIKAYTILNRTLTKSVISPKPIIDRGIWVNFKDDVSSSENSDVSNDESEDDGEGEVDSDTQLHGKIYPQQTFGQLGYMPEYFTNKEF